MVLGLRQENLRDVRLDLARMLGAYVVHGKATSATSTTLVDTVWLTFPNNTDLRGYWIYIFTGTGIGQERPISSFAAASDTVTVPAWTTTPDTTSEYLITRYFPASELDRAIDAAISKAVAGGVQVPWEDHSLGVNNIFNDPEAVTSINARGHNWLNWQFDLWDSANAPNGWTLVNSNSDEEDTIQAFGGHRRVLKLLNTGSSAGSAVLPVGNFLKWAGRRVRGYGILNADTASRAFVRVSDGVADTDSDNHDGDGRWRRLSSAWKTVSDDATALSASYRISSGAQITIRAAALQLIADYDFQEYIIPQAFTVITDVFVELTEFSDYGRFERVNPAAWEIMQGNPFDVRVREDSARGQDTFNHPRIRFNTSLPTPARIRLVGLGFPQLISPVPTTIGGIGATNYENLSPVIAPELIKVSAALALTQRLPRNAQNVSSTYLAREEERLTTYNRMRMPAGGRRVRKW